MDTNWFECTATDYCVLVEMGSPSEYQNESITDFTAKKIHTYTWFFHPKVAVKFKPDDTTTGNYFVCMFNFNNFILVILQS